MRVQIGLRHGGGQIGFELELGADQLLEQLRVAQENNDILDFTDIKGERALIPADSVAYMLISPERETKVGFARPHL